MEITTDIDLGLWLQLQGRRVVELFVDLCDQQALEQDEACVSRSSLLPVGRFLDGRNPVQLQRKLAPMIEDYYETEQV